MALEHLHLAAVALAAGNNDVWVVPADTSAIVTVNLVNISEDDVEIWLAIAPTDTPTNAHYIERVTLPPSAVLERTGIALQTGRHIVVAADLTGVSINVWGQLRTTEAP